MLQKTKAIVLKTIKYSDNSVIATVYSQSSGKIPIIIKSIHTKKSKTKINYLQPFFIIDIELYYKETRNIQKAKEIKPNYKFKTLPFDIIKSSIAIFLSEVLNKSIKEQEQNQQLYDFIEKSIEFIDISKNNISNFHLIFLIHLTKYLGFFPTNNFSDKNPFFDLENAIFIDYKNNSNHLNINESKIISNFLSSNFNNYINIKISKPDKNKTLQNILKLYKNQIPEFGKIKSLEIMQSVFN